MKKNKLQILFKIYKRYHCKIDNITKINSEYIIAFIYVSKRQIFKKSTSEIICNDCLLDELSPSDVALIGFYNTLSEHEKGLKN